jgi:hypothetical protein
LSSRRPGGLSAGIGASARNGGGGGGRRERVDWGRRTMHKIDDEKQKTTIQIMIKRMAFSLLLSDFD